MDSDHVWKEDIKNIFAVVAQDTSTFPSMHTFLDVHFETEMVHRP